MHLETTRKRILIIAILGIIPLLGISILIILLNQTKPLLPEVGLLYIDDYMLTVHPSEHYQEQSSNNEQLVYCLNTEANPSTCSWQDSGKFQIEYNYTYYVYIKSLDTNLISEPEAINYSIPDYSDYTSDYE